jgi:hypothetical protein
MLIMDKSDRKRRVGRPPRTAGYSVLVKRGELPERRTYLRQYLEGARAGIVKDVGGDESGLTTAQTILIDRTIGLLSVLRCIEESLAEDGVIQGGVLAPVLQTAYISYQNTCRLNLVALGLDKRAGDRAPDLDRYMTEKRKDDEGKAAAALGHPGRDRRS